MAYYREAVGDQPGGMYEDGPEGSLYQGSASPDQMPGYQDPYAKMSWLQRFQAGDPSLNDSSWYHGGVSTPITSVNSLLGNVLKQSGLQDYDFTDAINASSAGKQATGGWMTGNNPYAHFNSVLGYTNNPALMKYQVDPNGAQYASGNTEGQRNDQLNNSDWASVAQDQSDSYKQMAMMAAAAMSAGYGLEGMFGAGGATGIGAAGTPDAFLANGGYGGLGGSAAGSSGLANTFTNLLTQPGNVQVAGDATGIMGGGNSMDIFDGLNFDDLNLGGQDTLGSSAGSYGTGTDLATQTGTGSSIFNDYNSLGQDALKVGANDSLSTAGSGSSATDFLSKLGINPTSVGGKVISSLLGGGANAFGTGASGGNGGYTANLGGLLGGLMGYAQNSEYQKNLIDVMNKAVDKSDPFASQRPFYQNQLQQMYTDPNYFNNSTVLKGANQNAFNDTNAQLASKGYNMSGNQPMEIAQRLQNNNMNYAGNLMTTTAGAAGANVQPYGAGQVAATTGTNAATAGFNNMSLGNLFNTAWNGAQPNQAQMSQGAQPNQNLGQFIGSLFA